MGLRDSSFEIGLLVEEKLQLECNYCFLICCSIRSKIVRLEQVTTTTAVAKVVDSAAAETLRTSGAPYPSFVRHLAFRGQLHLKKVSFQRFFLVSVLEFGLHQL